MELFGHTKDVIRANYFYLMERMCPSKISDARDIPIIINNYNRLAILFPGWIGGVFINFTEKAEVSLAYPDDTYYHCYDEDSS